MTTSKSSIQRVAPALFRISAVLWAVWGIVHIFAGVMTLQQIASGDTAGAIHGIASAVELSSLQVDYPGPVASLLSQHGFNLGWFGLVTLAAAAFVWKRRALAVYLASLVGGLADLGYFLFIDLTGLALPPGPQMTYICAGAIVTGLIAVRGSR